MIELFAIVICFKYVCIMNLHLKQFIEYVKPFLYEAIEGKYSGHNFNSYLPKTVKENIPMHFRDLIQTSLHQIAKKSTPTIGKKKDGSEYISSNTMSKWYFDFIEDDSLKTIPSGCEPYYMPWILYEAIKCLELYLNVSNKQ